MSPWVLGGPPYTTKDDRSSAFDDDVDVVVAGQAVEVRVGMFDELDRPDPRRC